jgi:hypothetical protein
MSLGLGCAGRGESGAASTSASAATKASDAGRGSSAFDGSATDGAAVDAGAVGDAFDASVLNPHVAPGGNFDLSLWELQEPVGAPGAPTTIAPAQLVGPNGYHDAYFFTDSSDGSMTFWDPENGVTTPNSKYPRSELREMTAAGAAANWAPTGTNLLRAVLKATVIPDHVAVGQIHVGTGTPASTKPLLELFYYASGAIVLAIEQSPITGGEVDSTVGNVPLGSRWSYAIALSGGTITLVIDGGAAQTSAMPAAFNQEGMYFKAGDYDQSAGASGTVGAKVQFYALSIVHGP